MRAMYGPNEEEVKLVQQFVPDATPEQVKVLKDCMSSEAIYKGAIPCSLATMFGLHFLIPKRVGSMKTVATIGFGLVAYMTGKVLYAPLCVKKAFGDVNLSRGSKEKRDQFAISPGHDDTFDVEENQSGYGLASDNLLDAESEWRTADFHFESDTNSSDDTINRLQEDEQNVQEKTEKRVTYEDLWREHRKEKTQRQRRDSFGYE